MQQSDRKQLDDQYVHVLELYDDVKELIAACEKFDSEQKAQLSAINELRSAFDHVVRAHKVIYCLAADEDIRAQSGLSPLQYCHANLDKALGHIYRAGYDAYDVLSVAIDDEIRTMLIGRSQLALHGAIDRFGELLADIDDVRRALVDAKRDKDLESADAERRHFERYEQQLAKLTDFRDLLRSKYETIIELERFEDAKSRVDQTIRSADLDVLYRVVPGYADAVIELEELRSATPTDAAAAAQRLSEIHEMLLRYSDQIHAGTRRAQGDRTRSLIWNVALTMLGIAVGAFVAYRLLLIQLGE